MWLVMQVKVCLGEGIGKSLHSLAGDAIFHVSPMLCATSGRWNSRFIQKCLTSALIMCTPTIYIATISFGISGKFAVKVWTDVRLTSDTRHQIRAHYNCVWFYAQLEKNLHASEANTHYFFIHKKDDFPLYQILLMSQIEICPTC